MSAGEIEMGPEEWTGLHSLATSNVDMGKTVDRLEKSVKELTNAYLPSVSALLGPLLAAKMCTAAHGRK